MTDIRTREVGEFVCSDYRATLKIEVGVVLRTGSLFRVASLSAPSKPMHCMVSLAAAVFTGTAIIPMIYVGKPFGVVEPSCNNMFNCSCPNTRVWCYTTRLCLLPRYQIQFVAVAEETYLIPACFLLASALANSGSAIFTGLKYNRLMGSMRLGSRQRRTIGGGE